MAEGVSWRGRGAAATFAGVTGTYDTNYPVTNLADLINVSQVCRVTPAASAVAFTFIMPAAVSVQFMALVRHTLLAGSTFRLRLWSDNNPDPVGNPGNIIHDSTATAVWPTGAPVTGWPSIRPYLMSAAVTARSGRIDLASVSGAIEIGGVEVGEFWSWDQSPGKALGFLPRAPKIDQVGGSFDLPDQWVPRQMDGQLDAIALATAATTGIDFQKWAGRKQPFVYVQDTTDATSWPRSCALMTNREVPSSVGVKHRYDQFQFRFAEHWR